jgi:hypothetical protein
VDLGGNSSYLALGRRTPVYASDGGFIGVVKRVECDRKKDIFDGLVLSTPQGEKYLLAEHVKAVHEQGVETTISSDEALDLPKGHAIPTIESEGVAAPPVSWEEIFHWLRTRLGLGRVDDPRLRAAEERLARRERALGLARRNPSLALEAGVGRPDVRGAFHGEVVDINNASAGAIAGLPGINRRLALRIVEVRERVSGFSSLEEFGMVLDLPGDVVEHLRGLIVVLPHQPTKNPDDDGPVDGVPGAPA